MNRHWKQGKTCEIVRFVSVAAVSNRKAKTAAEPKRRERRVLSRSKIGYCPNHHRVEVPAGFRGANVTGELRVVCNHQSHISGGVCPDVVAFSGSAVPEQASVAISGGEPPEATPRYEPIDDSDYDDLGIDLSDGQRLAHPSYIKPGDVLSNGNTVKAIERREESGDWYVLTLSDGRCTPLLWRDQSIQTRNAGDSRATTAHVSLLEVGDFVEIDRALYGIASIQKLRGSHHWYRLEVSGDHLYALNGILVHNATRYWVGGSGNLDGSDTTHISASSGGAGGASYPTSADDLICDTLSNATAYAITVTGATSFGSVTWGAPLVGALTLAGSSALSCYGSWTNSATLVRTYTGAIGLLGTGSFSVTSAGITLASTVTVNGSGLTITLADALITTQSLFLTEGTFTTANFSMSVNGFHSSNTNTRTVNLGSSTVTLTGTTSFNGWNMGVSTNLTLNAGTSTVVISGNPFTDANINIGGKTLNNITANLTTTNPLYFSGGGDTFAGTVAITTSSGANVCNFTGGAGPLNFNNLNFSGFTGTWAGAVAATVIGNLSIAAGMTLSYTGNLSFTGTGAIQSNGKTFGSAITINGGGVTRTIADAFITTSSITLTNGTLSANAFALTSASFALGSGTKTLDITNITMTLTGTGTVWNALTNLTGFTLTSTGSTIVQNNASASAKVFSAAGLTYNNLTVSGGGSGSFEFRGGFHCNLFTIAVAPTTTRWQNGSEFHFAVQPAFSGAVGNRNVLIGVT